MLKKLSTALLVMQVGPAWGTAAQVTESVSLTSREAFLSIAIGGIIACALVSFFLAGRASERTHVALAMLIALIGAFSLFTLFGLAAREDSTIGVAILVGLIALFKLMNQFEIRRKSSRSESRPGGMN
jgi:hypothetical protein